MAKKTIKDKLEAALMLMHDHEIKLLSNSKAAHLYYMLVEGMDMSMTTTQQYFYLVDQRKIPPMETITRAFRKLRETHPQWQKPKDKVEEEINYVKEEAR